jgi:hypothetical protein
LDSGTGRRGRRATKSEWVSQSAPNGAGPGMMQQGAGTLQASALCSVGVRCAAISRSQLRRCVRSFDFESNACRPCASAPCLSV